MNGITTTFYHWEAQLTEHLDERTINAYRGTLFSMYAAGATVPQAAQAITEIDRRPDL